MIKKFIRRLLGQPDAGPQEPAVPAIPTGRRTEIPAEQHGIDPRLVDANAARVVRTLKDAGYEAYIVGGAVRDLIVGMRPKDFDVATDATPEQVKALFRRAFIIGRRFRLVHVVFGRGREHEVIEVSTFRAYLDASAAEQVSGNEKTSRQELSGKAHVIDASGRVLRDNVWGPQIEDAARRDFTINAMYYDPVTQVVVDYHGGLADARARTLRMIGDAAMRYREDPVRIIRVVRFAAKLGFSIERGTLEPIARAKRLLEAVPASRLFDEMVKLLQTGHALASVEQLRRHELLHGVFPVLEAAFAEDGAHPRRARLIELALADTDQRVAEGRAVAPSFLLACLLWHEVQTRWEVLKGQGEAAFPALQSAIDAVFDARVGDISGRGKLAADMREIWQMQPRFDRRTPATAASLAAQPRFRAGFDFLRLRADAGEADPALADWWEDYHLGDDDEREALLASVRSAPVARRVRAPRAEGAVAEAAEGVQTEVGEEGVAGAPRRRRRRRRSRGGGGGEGGGPAAAAASD